VHNVIKGLQGYTTNVSESHGGYYNSHQIRKNLQSKKWKFSLAKISYRMFAKKWN